ncbi:MAG: DUF1848 domain-containing protein [Rhodospirillales bacterium]
MIISASYKTDIPAFYGDWFLNRLKAGFCRMVNPYGGQLYTVAMDRDSVDGFVFWTRNLGPFFHVLDEVAAMKFPFVVQYTSTGYPKALDYSTIEADRAMEQIRGLSDSFGRRVAVWRYDPLIFTSLTPPGWHLENFARLAGAIAPSVDEVVVSFAQIYRKTARNMAAAARAFGFEWHDPEAAQKRGLLAKLAALAAQNGLRLTLCGQPELLVEGVGEAVCIDPDRLSDVAGYSVKALEKPHRDCCKCHASRDIGEYDTCPHGCVYCYGVMNRTKAKARYRAHDPKSDFLFPPPDGAKEAKKSGKKAQAELF